MNTYTVCLSEKELAPRFMMGIEIKIIEITWTDGSKNYDVWRLDTDELLFQDKLVLTSLPTDSQIMAELIRVKSQN